MLTRNLEEEASLVLTNGFATSVDDQISEWLGSRTKKPVGIILACFAFKREPEQAPNDSKWLDSLTLAGKYKGTLLAVDEPIILAAEFLNANQKLFTSAPGIVGDLTETILRNRMKQNDRSEKITAKQAEGWDRLLKISDSTKSILEATRKLQIETIRDEIALARGSGDEDQIADLMMVAQSYGIVVVDENVGATSPNSEKQRLSQDQVSGLGFEEFFDYFDRVVNNAPNSLLRAQFQSWLNAIPNVERSFDVYKQEVERLERKRAIARAINSRAKAINCRFRCNHVSKEGESCGQLAGLSVTSTGNATSGEFYFTHKNHDGSSATHNKSSDLPTLELVAVNALKTRFDT